ncbi:MAG TPA: hypothetical protein PK685_04415 [archaeon]|jgi:hypothetical protein|nr:hypothetical protein [archaeon]
MTRKKDAGELLYYLYKSLNCQTISSESLLKETGWGSWRLEKAIRYLREIDAIKITLFKEKIERLQKLVIVGLTSIGTQTIEDKDKFKITFGFELNLKKGKWSWQISK